MNKYLKIVSILPMLFISACSNANDYSRPLEDQNKLNHDSSATVSEVSAKQKQRYTLGSAKLDCSTFTLDDKYSRVCKYWQNSNRLEHIIDVKYFEEYQHLNPLVELSTIDTEFFAETEIIYKGQTYKAEVYPNSRIHLGETFSGIDLICTKKECSQPFLWDFITEATIGQNPHAEDKMHETLNTIYLESYQQYVKDVHNQPDKRRVKIFFDNEGLSTIIDEPYAVRFVNKNAPLSGSLDAYLKGVTSEEVMLEFNNNTLGINDFKVTIENKTAFIKFYNDNLEVKSPEQVLKFTNNITNIAQQFDNVDKTEICINDTYNYQLIFFANEETIACSF